MSLKHKFVLFVTLLLASLLAVAAAYAQGLAPGYPTDDDVNRVAKKLYCPVCPNTPLDVCETQACKDWRAQIRDQLTQGWSEQQVIDYFVAQYGERVLAEPLRKGFTSLVWLLPVIGTLLGVWMVYEILRGWRKRRPAFQPVVIPKGDIAPEVLQRIERELKEMD